MSTNKITQLTDKVIAICDVAESEGRALSAEESSEVNALMDRAKALKSVDNQLRSFGAPSIVGDGNPFANQTSQLTPGEVFTNSEGFKAIQNPASRGSQWTTGIIEIAPPSMMAMKGTLLEGLGNPGLGSGGGLIPTPQIVPGVVTTLFQRLTIESLLGSGNASGATNVAYANEGTATSAAAGVAEGGVKPESTLGVGLVTTPVKKTATTLTISDELASDVPALQNYLNNRLATFVNNEVERQIFRGTAGGNEVQGLFNRSIPVYAGGTAVGNYAKQTFLAANSMRGSAFVEPSWIALHPTDYSILRLEQDSQGGFYGPGPWGYSYGEPVPGGVSNQVTGAATDRLWGLDVYVTSGMGGAGTALIGTRENASVFNNGGLRAEISNSHASYFSSDLLLLRAERRIALACYRTAGYLECRYGGTA